MDTLLITYMFLINAQFEIMHSSVVYYTINELENLIAIVDIVKYN